MPTEWTGFRRPLHDSCRFEPRPKARHLASFISRVITSAPCLARLRNRSLRRSNTSAEASNEANGVSMSAANKRRKRYRVELRRAGIEVEREEKRGALMFITKHEGHLKGGSFAAAKMIEMLRGAVKDALDAGFAGLCAAGDMNWLLDEAPGSHEILEYEALLNHFFGTPTNKASACRQQPQHPAGKCPRHVHGNPQAHSHSGPDDRRESVL